MSLRDRAEKVLAQGAGGTNSKRPTHYPKGYPEFLVKGQGSTVWDTDGKKYIDFVCGLGAILFGYNHPKITEATEKQLRQGVTFSMEHPLVLEVAELIQDLVPGAERVRFLKNGDDATTAAVRIARAHKRKSIGLILSDGYHGRSDMWTSLTPPANGIRERFLVHPLKDEVDVSACDAVIVEPIKTDASEKRKEELTALTKKAPMIFDEVVTGFRVPKYTVAKWWDLTPDLICLGKGLGNGHPISVIAGKKEFMNEDYFISSTFSGETVSLAAAKEVIRLLKTTYKVDDLFFYGEKLLKSLNSMDPDIQWTGYGTRSQLNLFESRKAATFVQQAAKAGILFGRAWFYNFSHLEENVHDYVMNVCGDIVRKIQRKEVDLEGPMPGGSFVR